MTDMITTPQEDIPPMKRAEMVPWDQLLPPEKLERLRDELRSLSRAVSFFREQVWHLQAQFSEHQHVDGRLLGPLGRASGDAVTERRRDPLA